VLFNTLSLTYPKPSPWANISLSLPKRKGIWTISKATLYDNDST
jgi:hypothetical protein